MAVSCLMLNGVKEIAFCCVLDCNIRILPKFKVGNVDILVQLLMEINWKLARDETVVMVCRTQILSYLRNKITNNAKSEKSFTCYLLHAIIKLCCHVDFVTPKILTCCLLFAAMGAVPHLSVKEYLSVENAGRAFWVLIYCLTDRWLDT